MGKQDVIIDGIKFSIPDYYQRVDSMPDDPPSSIPYMVQTENALCFVLLFKIRPNEALPMNKQVMIDSIHGFLGDRQGLIEVNQGVDYIYSIVKTVKEPSGVQYVLTFQQIINGNIFNIQAYFDEIGTTGIRDNMVLAKLQQDGVVGSKDNPFEGWFGDPYDASYKNGILKNLSEDEQFDEYFPGFPLSMCREFLKTII